MQQVAVNEASEEGCGSSGMVGRPLAMCRLAAAAEFAP